jgi:hypothetical protein
MPHDTSKVLLGTNLSSAKEISTFSGVDPADFPAGCAVSLASTGLPSLLASAGMRIGVSLGASLSDTSKLAVLRTGESVPMLAHLKRSTGVITITNIANLVSGTDDKITVGLTEFAAVDGAVVAGEATFDARTGTTEAALSLATQINAHATASTLVYAVASGAVVTLYAKVEGAGTGHDVAVSYTDGDANIGATVSGLSGGKLTGGSNTISDIAYIAKGAKAYINRTTGKLDIAMTNFSTISDATYVSLELTGVNESGTEVAAAIVDMPGGL